MAFDAEAAWADLGEVIATRDGWGRDRLLSEMQKLQAKHRLQEGMLARFLRLYGGRLTLVSTTAEASSAGEGRVDPGSAKAGAAPIDSPGGRDDERRISRTAAA